MPMIALPYGHNEFDSDDLKVHIKKTGRDYIIQGQRNCSRADHPKPSSLDCWLRDNYAKNPDIKQAVNEVVAALVETGDFEEGEFTCPDSGWKGKGIRVLCRHSEDARAKTSNLKRDHMNEELIDFLRERTAENAAGTTALRNQGEKGVIHKARKFLRRLELYKFAECTTEGLFSALLDEKTKALQESFPPAARNWGAARKVLNLYLRDVLYSRYLGKYFGFNHLEKWLEVPLDSFVAKGIQLDFRPQTLVKFPGIKHLTQEVNQAYQEAAAAISSSRGYARVHLDIIYWRDIGQKGKKSE
jgi:hypothetical protein